MSVDDGGGGAGAGVATRGADPTRDPARRGLPRNAPRVLMYHYFGQHSWDHRRMFGMGEAELERHVRGAHTALQEATGVSARSFAYPFGTHDLAARTAVAAAGYDVAFAVAREHGRFAVDRVFVRSTDSLTAFQLKLTQTYRGISRAGGRAWRVRHRVRSAVAAARRR